MTPELIDELLEALMGDACARGAERLVLFEQEAVCFKGDEALHERPLDWRITGALVRRAMLGAKLDPWQFRRTQAGTLAGRWELTVEGDELPHRRVTVRPREPMAVRDGATARLDAVIEQLRAQLAAAKSAEDDVSPTELLTDEDAAVIKLVNLMMKDAFSLGATRIVASAAGGELAYPDGSVARRLDWPQPLWREVRGRLLYMCGLEPWQRGPMVSGFRLRFHGGRFATWRIDIAEADAPLVLNLLAEPEEPEEDASSQPPPPVDQASLSEPLRAVLDAPQDLSRRAVYADWLLERGDGRGRFIALQLSGREAAASPAQLGEWCGALRDLCTAPDARFAWGFVDRLVMRKTPDSPQLPALIRDPYWATVRALKLAGINPKGVARLLDAAPLSSLVALGVDAPVEPAPAAVLARLVSLSVSGLNLALAEWLDRLAPPKVTSLEFELEDYVSPEAAAEKLRRFFALKAAQSVRDVIVDWHAHSALWPQLTAVPASVERVSLPYVTPNPNHYGPREAYPEALVCTLQRSDPGAPFTHAIIHGELDLLYRSAGDVLAALAAYGALEVVRLVSRPRALDRGRETVLRRTCAATLPRVKVEVAVGEPEVPLWWLAETPAR